MSNPSNTRARPQRAMSSGRKQGAPQPARARPKRTKSQGRLAARPGQAALPPPPINNLKENLQRQDSPKSVATVFSSTKKNKLPTKCKKASETRKLRKMAGVVSHWRHHTLRHKTKTQQKRRRQAARRHSKKKISFPAYPANKIHKYDPESALTSTSLLPAKEDDDTLQTPWYELDYEELNWWEYPDLDEEDEITTLCRSKCRGSARFDDEYVDRVESLVWTASVKLKNLAQFVLRKKENKKTTTAVVKKTVKSPSAPAVSAAPASPAAVATSPVPVVKPKKKVTSSRGQPHPPPSNIPTMFQFMGLPREVASEKRRYRKAKNSANKAKTTPAPAPKAKTTVTPPKPAPVPVVTTAPRPAAVRKISREPVKKTAVPIETPSTWNRSTTVKPRKIVEQQTNKPTLPTGTASRRRSSVQKLKDQQKVMKEKEERLQQAQSQQKEAAKRLEAQQRRLERLKKSRPSSP